MRHLVVITTLVLGLAFLATPALSDTQQWTGSVMAIQSEEQIFTLNTKGKEIKIRLGPGATEELRALYGQLRVGDTVRVEADDEDLIAMSIKILPAPEQLAPKAETEAVPPLAKEREQESF